MQRMGQAGKNGAGDPRSYGDDISHFQVTNPVLITTNTPIFTCPYVKTGRYVFEGYVLLSDNVAETTTVGFGISFPGAGALSFVYSIPATAFSASGVSVAYNNSISNGATPSVNVVMSASDVRPLWFYGGLRIVDGTPPGNILFLANRTVGSGLLAAYTYSRIKCQNMEP